MSGPPTSAGNPPKSTSGLPIYWRFFHINKQSPDINWQSPTSMGCFTTATIGLPHSIGRSSHLNDSPSTSTCCPPTSTGNPPYQQLASGLPISTDSPSYQQAVPLHQQANCAIGSPPTSLSSNPHQWVFPPHQRAVPHISGYFPHINVLSPISMCCPPTSTGGPPHQWAILPHQRPIPPH